LFFEYDINGFEFLKEDKFVVDKLVTSLFVNGLFKIADSTTCLNLDGILLSNGLGIGLS